MANQTGIAITIRAFLQTGKTLNEQFEALSIVKTAHETGDYSELLKAATVEDVKTEQKTRRIEDAAPLSGSNGTSVSQSTSTETSGGTTSDEQKPDPEPEAKPEPAADADVPEFLKKDKKSKAA
ncbi:hypothetical protein [Mesorhizobium sp. M0296]|uniref:hypothetical protein n=1 Tax=Mesorhizobium sp. M0296 TaxID=2956931 RepID=UPI0033387DEF